MIEFHRVTKYYRGVTPALDDVSFKIEKGEFVYLVGPSGAGKTTALKLIIREEIPSSGDLFIGGKNIARLKSSSIPRLRRNIGFVFQDFRLIKTRTIFENVAFSLIVTGMPRIEVKRKVSQVLKQLGLYSKRHLLPDDLSGGEQQRVAIARAIVNEPAILLADEPTGNLDDETAAEILRLFGEINSRGTITIIATHDSSLISEPENHVIYLEYGRVIKDSAG